MNRTKVGMKIIGFNDRGDREKDDFYATPPQTTRALLAVENFDGSIYEPCCGQGHISKVFTRAGYEVESTDLVDRGFGTPSVDFLMETLQRDNIVTNPPYGKLAVKFAAHANILAKRKVAMLLKLQFLEGVERRAFFAHTPPATVYVFSNRQSLMKNGESFAGGMMALAWFVWDKAYNGPTVVRWL
tara:strand:+ start:51 stop:608 length:558 start_codon:yes stop_codon:yes gene_type:complete